jgi:hypothetical protein
MRGFDQAQRRYDLMAPPEPDEEPDLIPAPAGYSGTCAGCLEEVDADAGICECVAGPRIVDPNWISPKQRREDAAVARWEASRER